MIYTVASKQNLNRNPEFPAVVESSKVNKLSAEIMIENYLLLNLCKSEPIKNIEQVYSRRNKYYVHDDFLCI